jgi:hypothetical protein
MDIVAFPQHSRQRPSSRRASYSHPKKCSRKMTDKKLHTFRDKTRSTFMALIVACIDNLQKIKINFDHFWHCFGELVFTFVCVVSQNSS